MKKPIKMTTPRKYTPKEWEWPTGKGWNKQKRREYIKHIAETIGLFNVNKKELSEKFNCNRRTVYDDIAAIYKDGMDPKAVRTAMVDFHGANQVMLKGLMVDFIKSTDPNTKATLSHALVRLEDTHTRMMESYGVKEIATPITDTKIEVVWGEAPKKKGKKDD